MPIGVKMLKRPTAETSYLRATLKAWRLPSSHMFRPKVTMQYPEEKSARTGRSPPLARDAPDAHR